MVQEQYVRETVEVLKSGDIFRKQLDSAPGALRPAWLNRGALRLFVGRMNDTNRSIFDVIHVVKDTVYVSVWQWEVSGVGVLGMANSRSCFSYLCFCRSLSQEP